MGGGHISYTKALQETLALLKKRFGNAGCFVFTVRRSKRFPRSSFLAVPKWWPEQSVLVRPTSRGVITVAPLSILAEVKGVQSWCNSHGTPVPIVWLPEPLMRWGTCSDWQQYLSEAGIEEWRALS